MKNRTLTYRLFTGIILLLFTGSVFASHFALPTVKKEATTTTEKEKTTPQIKNHSKDALVQVHRVSVDKTAFLFRKIEISTAVAHDTRLVQPLYLPKILQTLFVSAIPKNAP